MPWLFDHLAFQTAAIVLSALTAVVVAVGTVQGLRDCKLPVRMSMICSTTLAAMCLSMLLVWSTLRWQVLATPEVIPSEFWREWRVASHLCFIALLLMITATDLEGYYILDWQCWAGLIVGVMGAVISGEFQLAHVWVDWNAEIPGLRGPDIPSWLAQHPHWHGLVWSSLGAACGAALTWLMRWISQLVLGRPTLGMGDVLLMGMAGAFLGWQPIVVASVLAPVLALGLGALLRGRTNRAALPYGPFLALACVLVLLNWGRIWMFEFSLASGAQATRANTFALRRFFGDHVSLLILAGGSLGMFVALLTLLRAYKSLPLTAPQLPQSNTGESTSESETPIAHPAHHE